MNLPFLILYVLQQLAVYFFVPLGLGLLLLASVVRSGSSANAKVACWTLLVVGVAGSLYGVPYWYEKATQERSAQARFDLLCRERAVTQFPVKPMPAEGVRWEAGDAVRESYFSRGEDSRDLVDPGRGRYVAIESRRSDGTGFTTRRWDPKSSRPGLSQTVETDSSSATLPFVVRTERLMTEEDARLGIDGIETTVTESDTQRVIARRVVYGRHPPNAKGYYSYTSVCPSDALEHADCGDKGCSVSNFVLAAVPPVPPSDPASAFQLFRGSGRQYVECSFLLSIGPSISPDEVEWWFEGAEFHLRIRSTSDHMSCQGLLSSANPRFPEIWFTGERSHYSPQVIHGARVRGTAQQPLNMAQTIAEHRRIGR